MSSGLRESAEFIKKRIRQLRENNLKSNHYPQLNSTGDNLLSVDSTIKIDQSLILPQNNIQGNIVDQGDIFIGKEAVTMSRNSSVLTSLSEKAVQEVMHEEQNQASKSSDETTPDENNLLIQEDIRDIGSEETGELYMGNINIAEIDSIKSKEEEMLDKLDVSGLEQSPQTPIPTQRPAATSNVTAAMRQEKLERKLAKQEFDKREAALQTQIDNLEDELSAANLEIEDLNERNRQLSGQANNSNQDIVNAMELLHSAGIPSELPDGTPLGISDAIMYLLDQHSISTSAINILRNDLRKLAYKWRREGRNDDADFMFETLTNSSKQGTFVAVTDISA